MAFSNQIESINITKKLNSGFETSSDHLIIEEPLEILIQDPTHIKPIKVCTTMRTPGEDEFLAIGFLYCEGILKDFDQITSFQQITENQVLIKFKEALPTDLKNMNRHYQSTSSCGICGVDSIDYLYDILPPQSERTNNSIKHNIILSLKSILNETSSIFKQTGGNHTAALFNLQGTLLESKEDVGRHNALDKLIGSSLKSGITPLSQHILLLSGRVSFELIQKSLMADIYVVIAIGAPTNLAVKLAKEHDLTLIGFLKDQTYNVYHGKENIEIS